MAKRGVSVEKAAARLGWDVRSFHRLARDTFLVETSGGTHVLKRSASAAARASAQVAAWRAIPSGVVPVLGTTPDGDRTWFGMDWVPGRCGIDDAEKARRAGLAAASLEMAMERIDWLSAFDPLLDVRPPFSVPQQPARGVFVSDVARRPDWQKCLAAHRDSLAPWLEVLDEEIPDCERAIVHGDLNPTNLIFADRQVTVVDPETLHWGLRGFDVVTLLATCVPYRRSIARAWLDAAPPVPKDAMRLSAQWYVVEELWIRMLRGDAAPTSDWLSRLTVTMTVVQQTLRD